MQDVDAPFRNPVSTAATNKSVVTIKVNIDGTKMNIHSIDYYGAQKEYGQMVSSPDYYLYGPIHLAAFGVNLKYDESDPYSAFLKKMLPS